MQSFQGLDMEERSRGRGPSPLSPPRRQGRRPQVFHKPRAARDPFPSRQGFAVHSPQRPAGDADGGDVGRYLDGGTAMMTIFEIRTAYHNSLANMRNWFGDEGVSG